METPSYSPYLHGKTKSSFLKFKYYYYFVFLAVNVFGFFWLVFFVSAFGQMVLASVFATWYWTFHKRNLPFFAVTEASLNVLR